LSPVANLVAFIVTLVVALPIVNPVVSMVAFALVLPAANPVAPVVASLMEFLWVGWLLFMTDLSLISNLS